MSGENDIRKEIKERTDFLNRAAAAYYRDSSELISNFEYDKLYDELAELEQKTGIVMSGSPTQRVGYETLTDLPKEAHPARMLSLDKTKSANELAAWLGDKKGLLSWKLDGLTVVLTYREGRLFKAVTRGNGEIGEVITNNARTFVNLPVKIPFAGETVLRGEAIITYADFDKINETIPELDAKYKNPRNLCSGSVRQLNNQITAERKVRFIAFALVSAGEKEFASRHEQFAWLEEQGFENVEFKEVAAAGIGKAVEDYAEKIAAYDYPSDGLVLTFDDIAYSRSLGSTVKFPRDSIAFKWRDEIRTTKLREIEWSASRTGLINPIAVFEPVELEGTTVSRASVHNVSILRELKLGIGDEIEVYKANMIIPQIARNNTGSDSVRIPDKCPVCGGDVEMKDDNGVQTLYCRNPECPAKRIKAFTLFVSRNAMDIEGLSESTIEKLTGRGFIKEPADFFRLDRYHEEIASMEGFGEKSYDNMIKAADRARKTTPERLLYALGISGIGAANAAVISKYCGGDWEKINSLSEEEMTGISGIGSVMARSVRAFFDDSDNLEKVGRILQEVDIRIKEQDAEQIFADMTFVITGSLEGFANRDDLKKMIMDRGGKVSGSVSKNTDFLINNDLMSTSSKNKKARELGVEIISEQDFCSRFGIVPEK